MSPSSEPSASVTLLLQAARDGDDGALERIVPLVYDDLRAVARRHIQRERPGHTLGATGLVHESYMRLVGSAALHARDRAHFLAIASRSMRQVLVDHARRATAAKRGGELHHTTLTDGSASVELKPEELLALDSALESLDERQRRVVECRFFGGMEESEIAEALGVSERTVRRDWVKARAWLYSVLYPEGSDDSAGRSGSGPVGPPGDAPA